MRFKWSVLTLLCVGALLWAWPAQAQEQSGSIQGVVRDASGGVLPGVTVEVRSSRVTGVTTTVTTPGGGPGVTTTVTTPGGGSEVITT